MCAATTWLACSLTLSPEVDLPPQETDDVTEVVTLSCGRPSPTLSEILSDSVAVVAGRWICVEADAEAADSLELLDLEDLVDGSVPWTVEGWFDRLERFVAEDLDEERVPGRLELEPARTFDAPVRRGDVPRRVAIGIRVDATLKGDAPAWIPVAPRDAPACRKDASERREFVVHAALVRDEARLVPVAPDAVWISETSEEAGEAQRILTRGLKLLASKEAEPAAWHRFVVDAVAHPATREDALGDLYRYPDPGDGPSVYSELTEADFRRLERAYAGTTRDPFDALLFLDVFDGRPSSQVDRATARIIAASLEEAGASLDDAERFDHADLWYLACGLAQRVRGQAGLDLLANLAFGGNNDDTAYWRMMWPVAEALVFSGAPAQSAQSNAPKP